MGECFKCSPPAHVPDEEMGQHLLDVHGIDVEAEVERWPDGAPVIIDNTLEADDFNG